MATCSFWRRSRAKAWFSRLRTAVFEGSLVRKVLFHIFNFLVLEGSLAHEKRWIRREMSWERDEKIRRQAAVSATDAGLFDIHVIISALSPPSYPSEFLFGAMIVLFPLNLKGRTPQNYVYTWYIVILFLFGAMIVPPNPAERVIPLRNMFICDIFRIWCHDSFPHLQPKGLYPGQKISEVCFYVRKFCLCNNSCVQSLFL